MLNKVKREVAADLAHILKRDQKGRATVILVPGSEGKQYRVILRRLPNRVMEAECFECTKCGDVPCKGNHHTVCYHAQAAINAAVADDGKIYWCKDQADAERVAHFDQGMPVKVTSRQCKKAEYWVVFAMKRDKHA